MTPKQYGTALKQLAQVTSADDLIGRLNRAQSYDNEERWRSMGRSTISTWFNGEKCPSRPELAGIIKGRNPKRRIDSELLDLWMAAQARITSSSMTEVNSAFPIQIGRPPDLADSFQIREIDIIREITRGALGPSPKPLFLVGLGGAGKTQLATHYVRSLQHKPDLLLWITASSRSAVVDAYAEAARFIGIASSDNEKSADAFLTWTERKSTRPWLVVFDDLREPADLSQLWPEGPAAQVLVTTRLKDNTLLRRGLVVEVGVFTPDEASDYLLRRIVPAQANVQDISALAGDLGRLPLALAQAASYLDNRPLITCSKYRTLLLAKANTLGVMLPVDARADGYKLVEDAAHATVTTTWAISMEAADDLHPKGIARAILEILSVLDPNGIPFQLLETDTAFGVYDTFNTESVNLSNELVEVGCSNLARFSLIDIESSPELETELRVHNLVQRVVRENSLVEFDSLVDAVGYILMDAWPEDDLQFSDAARLHRLQSNTRALRDVAGDELYDHGAHQVLMRAAGSFSAQPNQAVDWWRSINEACTRLFSPKHSHSLTSQSALASALVSLGRSEEAISLCEANLITWKELFPPGTPHESFARAAVAASRAKLGEGYYATGRYEQAIAEFEFVLSEDLSGGPEMLKTLGNLAGAYAATGRVDDALQILPDVVRAWDDYYGANDINALKGRNSLAFVLYRAGELGGAIQLWESTLPAEEATLGRTHPATVSCRNNLASAYLDSQQTAAAVDILESADGALDNALSSPTHAGILKSGELLATAYWQTGRVQDAVRVFERTLRSSEVLLGLDHPETVTARENLEFVRAELINRSET